MGVAGYYRVSVARDGMKAPQLYDDEIKRYCEYRRLELTAVFSDLDRSAFRGAPERPGLEELKRRHREFSAVVVSKLARFGRSVSELIRLFELFERSEVTLIFLDMNIDTSTSQGRLLRHIMAAFAEYESDVKADYARANHRLARLKGRPWGQPPYGYILDKENKTYVIDETGAEMVREIFSRYAQGGTSQHRIARDLNDANSGKAWTAKQVGRILDNPAYIARCIVDDDMLQANWKAIVDEDTWNRARIVRGNDQRRRSLLRAKKGGPYLLSGLLYCGYCGRKMIHRASKNRAGIYVCVEPGGKWCPGGSVKESNADDFVTQRFFERCRFKIKGKDVESFRGGERAWDKTSMADRRSLLSLAMSRVVVAPWPGGEQPQRVPSQRRLMTVVWVSGAPPNTQLLLISDGDEPKPTRLKVREGRSEMMRDLEARRMKIEQEARSAQIRERAERSRRSRQDWLDSLERMREEWQRS